jgi:hypothetical protein
MPVPPPYRGLGLAGDDGRHAQLRPPVQVLPDQGRRGDQHSECRPRPEQRAAEQVPRATDGDRHEQRQTQQHHLKLGHGGDPDHHAEHEEQTIVTHPLPSNQ